MSSLLQRDLSSAQPSFLLRSIGALAFIGLQAVVGCGEVTCPEPLSNVDGACLKVEPVVATEACDGVDNDGDTQVDEDWPELGQPCGESMGECVAGAYVCADDGARVVCVGAVGPSDEVCDGKDNDCDGTRDNGPQEVCDGEDNDCDGLIDEGVLSVKSEVFDEHATVTGVDGGFVVTRVVGAALRVETYDANGDPTSRFDVTDRPTPYITFLTSDSAESRVLVALGRYTFYVLDIHVDSDLVPIILETQPLHEDWRQLQDVGVYYPPYHPRVVASPPRFVGYRDYVSFALNPFAGNDLVGLTQEPTLATDIPLITEFDVAGSFVMWKQDENLRTGMLQNDGVVLLGIDVARGEAPGIESRISGPGIVYIENGKLRISELNAFTLRCSDGGFCNDEIHAEKSQGELAGPTALAYDEVSDTWFVIAGTQLVVVARGEEGAVIKQVAALDPLSKAPDRVEVAVSGDTTAVVQATGKGDSALTFLGCF